MKTVLGILLLSLALVQTQIAHAASSCALALDEIQKISPEAKQPLSTENLTRSLELLVEETKLFSSKPLQDEFAKVDFEKFKSLPTYLQRNKALSIYSSLESTFALGSKEVQTDSIATVNEHLENYRKLGLTSEDGIAYGDLFKILEDKPVLKKSMLWAIFSALKVHGSDIASKKTVDHSQITDFAVQELTARQDNGLSFNEFNQSQEAGVKSIELAGDGKIKVSFDIDEEPPVETTPAELLIVKFPLLFSPIFVGATLDLGLDVEAYLKNFDTHPEVVKRRLSSEIWAKLKQVVKSRANGRSEWYGNYLNLTDAQAENMDAFLTNLEGYRTHIPVRQFIEAEAVNLIHAHLKESLELAVELSKALKIYKKLPDRLQGEATKGTGWIAAGAGAAGTFLPWEIFSHVSLPVLTNPGFGTAALVGIGSAIAAPIIYHKGMMKYRLGKLAKIRESIDSGTLKIHSKILNKGAEQESEE